MTDNPVTTALFVFLSFAAVIVFLSRNLYRTDKEFTRNVLTGAHNTLMEIFMVGVVIVWLTKKGERRIENRRYMDEIDDLRNSNSVEGRDIIKRNIRRLNANGWNEFNLTGCKLDRIELNKADMRASILQKASLFKANLEGVDLRNADLRQADLTEVNLKGAKLDKARLEWAKLEGADLSGASLKGANLDGANVVSVIWDRVIFDGAIPPFEDFRLPKSENNKTV